MQNKLTRTCVQCDREFSLSEKEVKRHRANGFDLPLRCPECRKNKLKNMTPAPWDCHKRRPRKESEYD